MQEMVLIRFEALKSLKRPLWNKFYLLLSGNNRFVQTYSRYKLTTNYLFSHIIFLSLFSMRGD